MRLGSASPRTEEREKKPKTQKRTHAETLQAALEDREALRLSRELRRLAERHERLVDNVVLGFARLGCIVSCSGIGEMGSTRTHRIPFRSCVRASPRQHSASRAGKVGTCRRPSPGAGPPLYADRCPGQ